MAFGTLLDSGWFISDGSAKVLPFVQGVSWIKIVNMTEAAASNASHGVEYFWQSGMTTNDCLISMRNAAATEMFTISALGLGVNGIRLVDTSIIQTPNLTRTPTAISGAAIPVVSDVGCAAAGLAAGDIVRFYSTLGALQIDGIDFTVGTVNANDFQLAHMAQIVAAAAPGASARYVRIPYDSYWYPKHRYISKVAAWATDTTKTIVTLTVTHGYQIGQKVRFVVPAQYGMTQINGLQGTIVQMNVTDGNSTNTIVVDIDVNAFTAFAFPLTAAVPFSPAMVVPIGMDTAEALSPVPPLAAFPPYDILTDATKNIAYRGLILAAGTQSPAGQANDNIFWYAGTSYGM